MPTATRRPGRPARLSRDAVLDAAVAVADEAGLEAVSMRAIAARVGAEAMSLYRHVANKEDLVDGIVDLVYAEIGLPDPAPGWRPAMRARAVATREVLLRHPWAIALMESRLRPGPANLRHHDAIVGLLLDIGLSSLLATRSYNLVDSFVYARVVCVMHVTPRSVNGTQPRSSRSPACRAGHKARVPRASCEEW